MPLFTSIKPPGLRVIIIFHYCSNQVRSYFIAMVEFYRQLLIPIIMLPLYRATMILRTFSTVSCIFCVTVPPVTKPSQS